MKEEQEYLSKVIDTIDNKITSTIKKTERLKMEVDSIATPNFDERKYFQNCKNKIYESGKILKQLQDTKDIPYFGRMDLKIIEDGNIENIMMYIGEKSILEESKNLVYDWRSPVANLYYMNNQDDFNFNEVKYELNLKRQIEIEKSKLIKIYDSYIRGANLNVTDNFLQKVLETKKNRNEFTDIIRTIQANQNSIIRDDLFANTIVQGVAGSGKTVVLLHRLSFLLYNYKNLNKDKLIFITPSHIFKSKLSSINRSLSLTTIKMKTMEEYYLEKIKYYIPNFKVKMITKDDNNINLLRFIYSNDYLNYLDTIINDYFSSYEKMISKFNLTFDKTKILSSLTNNDGRIKKLLLECTSLSNMEELENIQKITKSYLKKENLKHILDIIYKDLKNKYNLKEKNYIETGRCNKCYIYTLFYLYIKYGFTTYNDYSYIFIDEMQDYSDNEFRLINKLEKNIHLNLYGDINQNILEYIDKKSINDLKNTLKDVLHTDNILSYDLLENYRNSKEITSYCNNFINTKMVSMGIHSDEVFIKEISNDNILDLITNNFKQDKIVIITKDQVLEDQLRNLNYEVYSIKMAKGLEFSKVLVIEEDFNETEKYIAYTRTLDKLYIYKKLSK